MVELFHSPQDLRTLRGQALRREDRVRRFVRILANVVEPAPQCNRPLGADITAVEVRRPHSGHERVHEGAFGQMSATNNQINDSHD